MRPAPTDGWILAGTVDGVAAYPPLTEDVAGLPHVLRLACDLAVAGVRRIAVVWSGPEPVPDLAAILADRRLTSRASISVVTTPPAADAGEPVVVVRADRVCHRDLPKRAIAAWQAATAPVAKVAGDRHDAVVVVDHAMALRLAAAALTRGGLATALAAAEVATAEPPYLAFTMAVTDRRTLRRAERQLVWSLRKQADGLAATLINRHLSLPVTWLLRRTPVHPNHVTVFCFALAVVGGVVIARGGWAAGVIGMLLVELGSIFDGVDGELARLKFRFARLGQWLDTLADDFGNVAYVSGITVALHAAGVAWAAPVGISALVCFAITQCTQYFLITVVYRSGDLAAIPWAFQSAEFLSSRPTGFLARLKATVPRMGKRDFAVTVFLGFAILGRLDWILVGFSAGAVSFFVVFWIQFFRNLGAVRSAWAARSAAGQRPAGGSGLEAQRADLVDGRSR